MKNINLSSTLLIAFLILTCINCFPQSVNNKVIRLYKGVAPGSEDWDWKESEYIKNADTAIYNVSVPTLTVFEAEKSIANGTAIVVCPGGGFHSLSFNGEGIEIAKWLNSKGFTAFVLKYRLAHCLTKNPTREMLSKGIGTERFNKALEPVISMSIADGKAAVAYVRSHASEWGLKRIGIMGFSAGGGVAIGVAFKYDAQSRPDFVAPIYPFVGNISNSDVPVDAPPMFIAVASDDGFGFNKSCTALYDKWNDAKMSTELHIYRIGRHGFALNKQNIPTDAWIDRFYEWLTNLE